MHFPTPRLVVLDIDGLLIKRTFITDENSPVETIKTVRTRRHHIELHSDLDKFWNKIFSIPNLEVALWTSSNEKTFSEYINHVVPECFREKFHFIWDRRMCTLDPDYYVDNNIKHYSTVKKLDTILSSPIINEQRVWNENNTLIIDDSEKKLRFNPEKTRFVFDSWTEKGLMAIFEHEFFGESEFNINLDKLKIVEV